jgi:hypothetical protein
MTYSIILFAVLFVTTACVHKPLNAHESKNWWLQKTHFWLEHLAVIQAAIIVNKLLDLLKSRKCICYCRIVKLAVPNFQHAV